MREGKREICENTTFADKLFNPGTPLEVTVMIPVNSVMMNQQPHTNLIMMKIYTIRGVEYWNL